ncbi:hypothetical protein GCM10010406_49150 [Streptomyces thermolineatus]|uniref:Uncharacterized protein n=1 Tax=Streptomyces thermolineatus TaxID=44033 RepID=A0ABP6A1P1_9ACTN
MVTGEDAEGDRAEFRELPGVVSVHGGRDRDDRVEPEPRVGEPADREQGGGRSR